MLTIRLAKYGSRSNPSYRIVVIEGRRQRQGKSMDSLGFWLPKEGVKKINTEKLNFWMKRGAKTTQALSKIL